ncbi:hypothetical protein Hte_005587 [Hypoxylon texense]
MPPKRAKREYRVSEGYLKSLEGALAESGPSVNARKRRNVDPGHAPQDGVSRDADTTLARRPLDPLMENSTVELFVSKLKQIPKLKHSPGTLGGQTESTASGDGDVKRESTKSQIYEYFALNYDTSHAKCTFKLPPYPYAIHLLDQFIIYNGYDWHWFHIRTFRRRLDNLYATINSAESKDRIWLCQLLVVFALGSCVRGQEPRISLGLDGQASQDLEGDTSPASSPPPGMEFFEQALALLKVPYEESSIDHLETVNLVLHKASSSLDCSPVEREHRKRVWWSTFCMDRMASTQMGLLPALQADQVDLEYPTQKGLAPDDLEEFSDPDYLTARVQLTIIQSDAANDVYHLGQDDARDIETILRPVLRRLDTWKADLPDHMTLGIEDGLPELTGQLPLLRSLANLHLRFNQIACIFSKEELNASQKDLMDMNDTCLRSARSNLRILIDVRSRGLLARLGIMENMHLFSSLMVLSLAMSINARHPNSFQQRPDDALTYESGKDVLHDMTRAGSLAARGHEKMLSDVEALGRSIEMDGTEGGEAVAEQWDIDEWMTQLLDGENVSDIF